MWSTIAAMILFAGSLVAGTVPKTCETFLVPVWVNAVTKDFGTPAILTNIDAAAFALNESRAAGSTSDVDALKNHTVNAVFNISATLCVPTGGVKKSVLHILTHGVGFDHGYWDWPDYSYVDFAAERGYATLSYDRLTSGKSSRPDPYLEAQGSVEVAVLGGLTQLVRNGTLESLTSLNFTTPEKTVHVGHSLGSVITNGFAVEYPELSDGIVLTGFVHYTNLTGYIEGQLTLNLQLARLADPARFSQLPGGYLLWATATGLQIDFFNWPYFDPAILEAVEKQRQPVSVGELSSLAIVPLASPSFSGYVQVVAGKYDLLFCGNFCDNLDEMPNLVRQTLFPNASDVSYYVQPDMAHAINLHYNATGAYKVILDKMQENGL